MDAAPPRLYAPPPGFTRLRLTVAWDGRDFAGWQQQLNAASVQETLQVALEGLGGQGALRPVAAGRTDAGVHAEAMPIHWDVPPTFRIPLPQLPRALNARLPTAVSVLSAEPAPSGFHARFSCTQRRYVYRLWVAPQRHPLWAGRALHVPGPLNLGEMNRAAQSLLGLHDFAAYCKPREEATTIRTLLDYRWTRDRDGVLVAAVKADAFCHSMVRALVGACAAVGEGKLEVADVARLRDELTRTSAFKVLPARGLTLAEVGYPADELLASRAEQTRARRDRDDG